MSFKTGRKQTGLISYSEGFKKMVVEEYESSNEPIHTIQKKYYIGGNSTVKGWIKKYGKERSLPKQVRVDMKGESKREKARIKELEQQVKELKLALADETFGKKCIQAEYTAYKRIAMEVGGEEIINKIEKKSPNMNPLKY